MYAKRNFWALFCWGLLWTFVFFFCIETFLISVIGAIFAFGDRLSSVDPSQFGEHMGHMVGMPLFLLAVLLVSILTVKGVLPGTKRQTLAQSAADLISTPLSSSGDNPETEVLRHDGVIPDGEPAIPTAAKLKRMELPKKEPRGIGGWLILPALGFILWPFVLMLGLYRLLKIFTGEKWILLTLPGAAAYDALWEPLLYFEAITNSVFLICAFCMLWLFFTKSKRVPMIFIILAVLNSLAQLIDYFASSQIHTIQQSSWAYEKILMQFGVRGVWILYFLTSRRVKNTFIKSVS